MSTLYANFHHDRHRQTAGQHIQPEKKPRAVQMHAAQKIDAEHNPLIPADHHATASTHTNLRYAPSGFTLLPITDYAQEIMGTQMPTGQHGLKSANPGELGAHSNVQIPQPARWRYSVRACAWGLLKCSQGTAPLNNSVNGFPPAAAQSCRPSGRQYALRGHRLDEPQPPVCCAPAHRKLIMPKAATRSPL